MTSSKISKIISIGIRIAALLLIVLFFVPSICVSCDGMEASFSAFESALGKVEEDIAMEYDYILFVLLLLPLVMLICTSNAPMITATVSAMNIVSMIVYIIMVKIRCNAYFDGIEMMIEVKPKLAFILNILISLAVIGAAVFEDWIIDRFAVPEDTAIEEPCCKACGTPRNELDQFCPSCGAKLDSDSDTDQ